MNFKFEKMMNENHQKINLSRFISPSKNFWTIGVAMCFVWIWFTGMAGVFSNNIRMVGHFYLIAVVCSFWGAGVVIKILQKILAAGNNFSNLPFSPFWIFVLILGSVFFSIFLEFNLTKIAADFSYISLKPISGIFMVGFVPAAFLRIMMNIILVTRFFDNKEPEISIFGD